MKCRTIFLSASLLVLSAGLPGSVARAAAQAAQPRPVSVAPPTPRTVALQGQLTSPRIETKLLPSGLEGLPVWFLPRLGVSVRNAPDALNLGYGPLTLTYTPASGWSAQTTAGALAPGAQLLAALPVPENLGSSLHVALSVLRLLNVPLLADTPEVLDFGLPALRMPTSSLPPAATPTAPPSPLPSTPLPVTPLPSTSTPPVPPAAPPSQPSQPVVTPPPGPGFTPVATLASVRSSRTVNRNIELQRVVMEFDGPANYTVLRDRSGLTFNLPGVLSAPQSQRLDSGDALGVSLGAAGSSVRLDTGNGSSEIFTLPDPYRIVVDTTTNIDTSVPPPIDETSLPDGVTLRHLGGLSLLIFDARYAPRVVSAPLGHASGVADLVRQQGGVAGVNGGYFDTASSLPVDLVARGGLMIAPSLERRATLGLDAQGTPQLGYPKPRYVLSAPGLQLVVNSVGSKPNPLWVTAFVGDGRTAVGGDGFTTLVLRQGPGTPGSTVSRALSGRFVPGVGDFAVTFDPARFPQLGLATGAPLRYDLNWQVPGWNSVQEALAAGPLLVSGGKVVLDPVREGFDTSGSIWRPTRQVAFVQMGDRSGIAFLDNGTPAEFARALAGAGVSSAMRLDSGSSATVYVSGGYLNAGGYLNTVWSRPVPNALVFVPKLNATGK
ncbi:phosphodiester glycosidase family protein [Deinococcus ruber]|uniref:phosphodiester glycosidase family protein n=1 Tax=Deinococcus ruber TaxID=1848197 RepID=UPI001E341D2F|nr:phosphodiester glycosidase family protein [Deinococcus ruber]